MKKHGFTLVELMVALAVSLLLMGLLFSIVQQVTRATRRVSNGGSAFDEARMAFAQMRHGLEEATLNPYWNVNYDANGFPRNYNRMSDLHFLCGPAASLVPGLQTSGNAVFFQAPLGFDPPSGGAGSALNALGYFVEYRDVNSVGDLPLGGIGAPLLHAKFRFQLREFRQPASALTIFDPAKSARQWFIEPLSMPQPPVTTIADNVALLVMRARISSGTNETMYYQYDSRSWMGSGDQPVTSHQLPSIVDIVMLAFDSQLMERMSGLTAGAMPAVSPPGIFEAPEQLDVDVKTLEDYVAKTWPQGNFQIFRASVPLRAAKWSNDPGGASSGL